LSSLMKPERTAFTPAEWRIIQKYRTPKQVQSFLRTLHYNHEEDGDSQRSFREAIKRGSAHCLEAALTAAVILEQHGYPPLLLSFESIDELDHVIYIFKEGDRWGSVARSRDAGLHGRKPLFRTPRDLALSYVDPYVDFTGRIKGYAVINLEEELDKCDWRFSPRNLWKLENFLLAYPHIPIKTSNRRYEQLLATYKKFRERFPKKQATYYKNTHQWM
jgi:hypothetical protein